MRAPLLWVRRDRTTRDVWRPRPRDRHDRNRHALPEASGCREAAHRPSGPAAIRAVRRNESSMRSAAPGGRKRSNPRRYFPACSGAAELRHSVFAKKEFAEKETAEAASIIQRQWPVSAPPPRDRSPIVYRKHRASQGRQPQIAARFIVSWYKVDTGDLLLSYYHSKPYPATSKNTKCCNHENILMLKQITNITTLSDRDNQLSSLFDQVPTTLPR